MDDAQTQTAIDALNRIMELELAGVVKYTHYSLMVYGYNRIPIVSWLKGNADESLAHAHKAGELVTLLGGHPSLKIGQLLETEQHDIGDILRESLAHEKVALAAYYDLLKIAEGQSVLLEEYAREMIVQEELHLDEVNKILIHAMICAHAAPRPAPSVVRDHSLPVRQGHGGGVDARPGACAIAACGRYRGHGGRPDATLPRGVAPRDA